MESKIELKRNEAALSLRIQMFTVSYIILGFICIAILTVPFRLGDNNFLVGTLAILIIALLGLMGSISVVKKKWRSTKYYITDNAIIVSYGVNSFKEDVYRFDSIITANISQSSSSKRRGYGDIVLRGPHIKHDIVLKDIDRPAELVGNIHQKLAHNSTNPTAIAPHQ